MGCSGVRAQLVPSSFAISLHQSNFGADDEENIQDMSVGHLAVDCVPVKLGRKPAGFMVSVMLRNYMAKVSGEDLMPCTGP